METRETGWIIIPVFVFLGESFGPSGLPGVFGQFSFRESKLRRALILQ